ncbi:MAG: RDD family protein [Cytophagaceae bacterium]|nr:RDD family protein [Cytophagaceae bacterium]
MQDLLDHDSFQLKAPTPVHFADRFGAWLTDILIMFAILFAVFVVNVMLSIIPNMNLMGMVIIPLLVLAYFVYEAFTGKTPGKINTKLVVADVQGNIASTGRYFFRFFGCFLAFGKKRQALHDRIAGTAVFRRQDIRHS